MILDRKSSNLFTRNKALACIVPPAIFRRESRALALFMHLFITKLRYARRGKATLHT